MLSAFHLPSIYMLLSFFLLQFSPPSFVADLRHESMLMSSWGYFLANFSIVINFILHLAPHQLETATTSEDEMTYSPFPFRRFSFREFLIAYFCQEASRVRVDRSEEQRRERCRGLPGCQERAYQGGEGARPFPERIN